MEARKDSSTDASSIKIKSSSNTNNKLTHSDPIPIPIPKKNTSSEPASSFYVGSPRSAPLKSLTLFAESRPPHRPEELTVLKTENDSESKSKKRF